MDSFSEFQPLSYNSTVLESSPNLLTPASPYVMANPDKVFVGSIDQGTTSSRFLIFDRKGEPVAVHQEVRWVLSMHEALHMG